MNAGVTGRPVKPTTPGQIPLDQFAIWSNEHNAWWRPNSAGYTTHFDAAGTYGLAEAVSICRGRDGWTGVGTPSEIMVPIGAARSAIRCDNRDQFENCDIAHMSSDAIRALRTEGKSK